MSYQDHKNAKNIKVSRSCDATNPWAVSWLSVGASMRDSAKAIEGFKTESEAKSFAEQLSAGHA